MVAPVAIIGGKLLRHGRQAGCLADSPFICMCFSRAVGILSPTPAMSFRRASFLLAAAWALPAAAVTFPQTVEVDLIFPRNETYAPSEVFPIVFAFQNAALIPSLDPSFDINLWVNVEHNTSILPANIDLTAVNFSSAAVGDQPLYVYTFATNLNTTNNGADAVTLYNLVWAFGAGNCSGDDRSATTFGGGFESSNVIFTIAQSGAAPEISNNASTSTNASACTGLSHLAFNVTGTLPVADTRKWDGHNTCAVFSDTTPTPVGSPCAATADASAAASISAAATSKACAAFSPAISCPSKKSIAVALSAYTASAWAVVLFSMVL
ncbi:hypothetical protein N7527_006180 [Penicillium freii]|nr:hypothetical protein N7527_006180 [Penicillium freii]